MADYYDFKGIKRAPGEPFYDGEGIKRAPGEDFYDGEGIKRSPGESFYDGEGIKRAPGEPFYDGEGIKRYPDGWQELGGKHFESNALSFCDILLMIISAAVMVLFFIYKDAVYTALLFAFRWLYLPCVLGVYAVVLLKRRNDFAETKRLYLVISAAGVYTLVTRLMGGAYISSGTTGIPAFIFFVCCFLPLVVYSVALPLLSRDYALWELSEELVSGGRAQMMGLMILLELLGYMEEADDGFFVVTFVFGIAIVIAVSYFLAWLASRPFELIPTPAAKQGGAALRQTAPVKREAVNPPPVAQHRENAKNLDFILAVICILGVPAVLSLILESLTGSIHGIIDRWTFMISTWLCVWAILLPLVLYPLMARCSRKSRNTEKPMWMFTLIVPLFVVALFIAVPLLAQAPFLSFAHLIQRQAGIYDINKWLIVMLFTRIAASALPCTAYALLLLGATSKKKLKRFWWCAPLVILAVTAAAGYLLTASFQLGAYGTVVGFMMYGMLSLLSLPLICREYKKNLLWSAVAVSLAVLTAATVLTLPRVVSRIGAEPAGVAQAAAPTVPANSNELALEHAAGFMGNTPGNMSNWGFCCEGEYMGEAIWYIGLTDGLYMLHSDKTVTQIADDGWYNDLLYTGETLVYTRGYDESMAEICVGLPSEHTVVESTDLNRATLYSNNLLGDTLYGNIEYSTGEGTGFVYNIVTGEMSGMTGPCAYLTEERLYYFIDMPATKNLMYMSVETNTPSFVASVGSNTTGVMLEFDGKLYLRGDEGSSSFDLLTGEMEATPFEGIFINTDGEFIYWVSAQFELCRYDPDSGAVDVLCSLADVLTGPNGNLWPVQLSCTDIGFVLTPLLSNVLILVDADDYSVQTLISPGVRYRSEASYSGPAYDEPDTEFPVDDTVQPGNLGAIVMALDGMFSEMQGAGERDSVNRCGLYDVTGDSVEDLLLLYFDWNGYLCWRVWDVSSDSAVELGSDSIVGFPGGREAQWAHIGMCTYGGELYFYASHGDREYTVQFYSLYNFDDLAAGQAEYLSGELPADCSEIILLSTDGDDLCGDAFANFYALRMNAALRSAGGPTES